MHGVDGAPARVGTDEGATERGKGAVEARGGHRPGLHPEPRQVARHGAGSPGGREEREPGEGGEPHTAAVGMRRANIACVMAVGRDVPIAPPG